MATASFTTPIPTGAIAQPNFLQRTIRAFGEWVAKSNSRTELSQMSDHDLKDIGLTRGTIDEAVRTARYSY